MQNPTKTGLLNHRNQRQVLQVVERFKLRFKFLKIIVYQLPNGEKAVTFRQAAIAVKKTQSTLKEFLRSIGVRPQEAKLPNHCSSNMVPLSVVEQYWKYLNRVGQGNLLTQLGEEMLANYLNGERLDC